MSQLDLYAEFASGKLVSEDGGAPTIPTLVLGDTLVCSQRILERVENDLREKRLNVRTLHASIGKTLEPPTGGEFRLKVESPSAPGTWHNSAAIAFDATVGVITPILAAMVQPLTWTVAAVTNPAPGCWMVKLSGVASPPAALKLLANTLAPESFVRIRPTQQADGWWHEIRLIQAPLAWNEDGHERVLAPPPTIRRLRGGRAGTDTEPPQNEIQDLLLPHDFRGTYFFRWQYRASKYIGHQDGADIIAQALNGLFPDNAERFKASVAEDDHAYIEFVGDLAGAPQPLIEVEVNTFAPGVITFALPLDRAVLAAALRTVKEIELPFEVEMEVVDDDQDAADPAIPGRIYTLFQQPVKIVREQIWKELAVIPKIAWARPTTPVDYIPVTRDQILFATPGFRQVIGNGVLTSFTLDHPLATSDGCVVAMENTAGKRVLFPPDEFTYSFPSDGEIALEFTVAPPVNGIIIIFIALGEGSFFQAHTHTMAQILGLLDALSSVYGRLDSIEDLLPTSTLARRASSTEPLEIEIPEVTLLFPSGRLPADFDPKSIEGDKAVDLPRPPGLLPAIHDATVADVNALPASITASAGNVFRNTSGAPILVPGGLGRRGGYLENNGFVGSDGRVWYRLDRSGASNSYYPADFERELFLLPIMAEMWQPGGNFEIKFDLDLRTVAATTRAQYLVVIEVGTPAQQAAPAPVAMNLSDIAWRATPILAQRVILSGIAMKHTFGALIRRSLTNEVLTAEKLLYKAWTAAPAGSQPETPTFVIRARLIQFDTENSVPGALGFIYAALTEATASIN